MLIEPSKQLTEAIQKEKPLVKNEKPFHFDIDLSERTVKSSIETVNYFFRQQKN